MAPALSGLRGERRGRPGEDRACRHLERRGYRILERNWRCRSGEIDVVALDGEVTVFVEVKQRGRSDHGAGHEAVTRGKRRRLVRAARLYALARGLEGRPVRFDVISIDPGPSGETRLRHDEGAFTEVD